MTKRFSVHRKNLDKIFYPKSIAVVGTNNMKGTVPYDILFNILKAEFTGILFPVSPGEKSICSIKSYRYVVDISDPVDLAILVFPAQVCAMALEQCGQKGIKGVIIISAGFKEIGSKGLDRELQLRQIAEKYDISFIGPNCLGIINTDPAVNLNASFARKMPEQGSIGFLSQSGALCTAVLDYARAKHIGFSKFISFGNKADISEIDLLEYLKEDEATHVILLYLEEVSDGQALMETAREIAREKGKPLLILKSGRTTAGANAAASHTGSLAGSDEICDAAFRQAGIIRCADIEEMFNIAIAFAYQPKPVTNKVAIITNAGGPGVLTTDAAISEGLELASFSEETTQLFKRSLPATANIKNPVDVIGDARADRYSTAISGAMKDPDVSGIFVILTPQSMTDIESIAHEIVGVTQGFTKPVYASFMGEADVKPGVDILQRNKIPHYILPESMCRSFSQVFHYHARSRSTPVVNQKMESVNAAMAKDVFQQALHNHHPFLAEDEASKLLDAYHIPVKPGYLTHSADEAVEAAKHTGYPVVLKIISDQIFHKSEVHGVALNLNTPDEVRQAYLTMIQKVTAQIPLAEIRGIYVTPMIPPGTEVFLGLKSDPSFGHVIVFGLGGIFVEVYRDISFRIPPLSTDEIDSMIKEIKAYPLLLGVRGTIKRDIDSLKLTLLRFSQLAMDFPEINEMDINPLILLEEGKGCFAADVKILFRTTT